MMWLLQTFFIMYFNSQCPFLDLMRKASVEIYVGKSFSCLPKPALGFLPKASCLFNLYLELEIATPGSFISKLSFRIF